MVDGLTISNICVVSERGAFSTSAPTFKVDREKLVHSRLITLDVDVKSEVMRLAQSALSKLSALGRYCFAKDCKTSPTPAPYSSQPVSFLILLVPRCHPYTVYHFLYCYPFDISLCCVLLLVLRPIA